MTTYSPEEFHKLTGDITDQVTKLVPDGVDYVIVFGTVNEGAKTVNLCSGGNLDLNEALHLVKCFTSTHDVKETLQ